MIHFFSFIERKYMNKSKIATDDDKSKGDV